MHCRRCDLENRPGRRFCAECGAQLVVPCPECDWANEPGEKYCGGCGHALIGQHGPPAQAKGESSTASATEDPRATWAGFRPERRQLTVMFCDLVGSTSLATRLDPEDLRDLIRAYQAACGTVVKRYGGVIARYMGDGIMIYFGYPHAHEDDAERAARVGLEVVEAVRTLNTSIARPQDVTLAVRIGIATGLVVAGDLIGEAASEEMAVVGETPNLAARLQGIAEPDTVVLSDNTHRVLGDLFDCEDLGEHHLEGFPKPVHAWRAEASRDAQSRFGALHGAAITPLVGRDAEMERLLGAWERAKLGEGQVLLVSGEPGIGKSRLAEALRERVSAEVHYELRYQCSPFNTNSALYPFIRQLELAAGFQDTDSVNERLEKLRRLLETAAGAADEVMPLFASLLSISQGAPGLALEMGPKQQRDRTLAAFADLMNGLTARRPVLAIVEDVHWMDPTSLELLDIALGKVPGVRLLLVVTFRPDFNSRWSTMPNVTGIPVGRLDRAQCTAMVGRLTGGRSLPSSALSQIIEKTDGVPLFVEELVKTVLASGLLQEEGDRYVSDGPLPARAIPDTLQASLMARLDQLASARDLAQVASVVGREFGYALIAAVSERPDRELRETLEELQRAGLILGYGDPPQAHYEFRHALVRDAAYESLLRSRRQQLHRKVVAALQRLVPERAEVEPELFAHHYTEAGLPGPAVNFWIKAGLLALRRSANMEVIGHIRRGLHVLESAAPSRQRTQQELEMQIMLGAAYRVTQGFAAQQVERCFGRALDLCDQLGESTQRVDVVRALYTCHYVRGELSLAREQAEQVLALGRDRDDSRFVTMGQFMTGAMMFWQGEFVPARAALEEAYHLYNPRDHRSTTLAMQIDVEVTILNHLGWTLWILGHPARALEAGDRAMATARGLSQPFTLAMALFFACAVRDACGRHDECAVLLEELRQLTVEHGFSFLGACATVLEGRSLIAEQKFESGMACVNSAFVEFSAQQAGLAQAWAMSGPIEACLRLGRQTEGLAFAARARESIGATGERHWEAEIHRLAAELHAAGPSVDLEAARAALQRAQTVATEQGARALELRIAMTRSRLSHQLGDRVVAERMLAEVLASFEDAAETADVREAREISGAPAGPATPGAAHRDREQG